MVVTMVENSIHCFIRLVSIWRESFALKLRAQSGNLYRFVGRIIGVNDVDGVIVDLRDDDDDRGIHMCVMKDKSCAWLVVKNIRVVVVCVP